MYLLDTNTVIDFCNSKLPLNARNLLNGIEPIVSVITSIELFASNKTTQHEKFTLEEFIKIAIVYESLNTNIVARTIEIRQQYNTKLPDAIIAATALVYDLILITRNTKDFGSIEGLKVIDPLENIIDYKIDSFLVLAINSKSTVPFFGFILT